MLHKHNKITGAGGAGPQLQQEQPTGPWQPHESAQRSKKPVPELVTEHIKRPRTVINSVDGGFGRSPDNLFVRTLRPMLPVAWQYGARWSVLTYTYRVGVILCAMATAKWMLYDPHTEAYLEKLPEYDFVHDDAGRVTGVAPRRVVQQIHKSRERSAHWRRQTDET